MTKNPVNLIMLRGKWGHMADVSGFDPLCSSIDRHMLSCTQSVHAQDWSILSRLAKRIGFSKLFDSPPAPSPFVTAGQELAGKTILRLALRDKSASILLPAGEDQYGGVLSQAPASVRGRLVVCFHQPPSWMRLHWRDFSTLDGLKAIVCLCRHQQEYFAGITSTPTILIRHGVRHDFFEPSEDNKITPPRLLFVGQWLRDFETLASSMHEIWRKCPGIELDCVIPRHSRENPVLLKLARNPNVRWHAGILPEELRELYQKATLLFLPLVDAVANNAIVESLACGLPIVSTDVGGIREYVPEGGAVLCPPGDPYIHSMSALELLHNDAWRRQASAICRQFAVENLDWINISRDLLKELGLCSRMQ